MGWHWTGNLFSFHSARYNYILLLAYHFLYEMQKYSPTPMVKTCMCRDRLYMCMYIQFEVCSDRISSSLILSFPPEITRSSKLVSITTHWRILQGCIVWEPARVSLNRKVYVLTKLCLCVIFYPSVSKKRTFIFWNDDVVILPDYFNKNHLH